MYDATVSAPSIHFALSAGHGGVSLIEAARAFAGTLAEALHQPVECVVVDDYEQLLTKLLANATELAWMPPLLLTRAMRAGATVAVVSERDGSVTYRSAILVPADSPAASVGELRDVRAAWTDRHSAAGHLVPRLHLQAAGVSFAKEMFAGSPQAACAAVARGDADLCGCAVRESAAADPSQALADVSRVYPAASKLRVIAITEAIPPDGIVFAPAVAPADAARYIDVLTGLHLHAAGSKALWDLMSAARLVRPSGW